MKLYLLISNTKFLKGNLPFQLKRFFKLHVMISLLKIIEVTNNNRPTDSRVVVRKTIVNSVLTGHFSSVALCQIKLNLVIINRVLCFKAVVNKLFFQMITIIVSLIQM